MSGKSFLKKLGDKETNYINTLISRHLFPNEVVEFVAKKVNVKTSIFFKKMFIITNQRLFFYDKEKFTQSEVKALVFTKINSVKLHSKLIFATIEVVSNGNSIYVDNIPLKEAKEFVSILQTKLEKKIAVPIVEERDNKAHNTPHSKFAELKEYKELLDLGIISQEEFDKKKGQLLK